MTLALLCYKFGNSPQKKDSKKEIPNLQYSNSDPLGIGCVVLFRFTQEQTCKSTKHSKRRQIVRATNRRGPPPLPPNPPWGSGSTIILHYNGKNRDGEVANFDCRGINGQLWKRLRIRQAKSGNLSHKCYEALSSIAISRRRRKAVVATARPSTRGFAPRFSPKDAIPLSGVELRGIPAWWRASFLVGSLLDLFFWCFPGSAPDCHLSFCPFGQSGCPPTIQFFFYHSTWSVNQIYALPLERSHPKSTNRFFWSFVLFTRGHLVLLRLNDQCPHSTWKALFARSYLIVFCIFCLCECWNLFSFFFFEQMLT